MNREKLKSDAKKSLVGKIGILFVICLIIALINSAGSYIGYLIPFGIGGICVTVFLSFPFNFSLIYVTMVAGDYGTLKAGDAFIGFKKYWQAVGFFLLKGLLVFLWTLLFIIPGIIKSYAYAMADYMLVENPETPAEELIRRSKKMMEGHKADLFVLDLSFIGWVLLSLLTFGILFIWIIPYIQVTRYNFYKQLKGETAGFSPMNDDNVTEDNNDVFDDFDN